MVGYFKGNPILSVVGDIFTGKGFYLME